MISLKDLLARILNPRSLFGNLPSLANNVGKAMDASEERNGVGLGGNQGRLSPRDFFTNIPLIIGIVIVLGLFVLVLLGPVWSPKNPYIAGQNVVAHFDIDSREFIRPPLDPSPEFILGTNAYGADILSLLMHGARTTLVVASFITVLRVILGLLLGGISGWNEGKTIDRLIMGGMGVVSSLPLLISTTILIFALDIRRGIYVFVFSLSILGWSEIAQYIRSEFLVLREKPFIESALASGSTSIQIAIKHILPNVISQMLIISFLEMGAVLMLLGELGFLGIYIGGGSKLDLSPPMAPPNIITLIEIPEWGAMIADGFRWFRSKPFIVIPPAIAIFVSVFGFNSLGEGLRRLMEKQTLNTGILLKKEIVALIAAFGFATVVIINNTGAAPWYADVAAQFSADHAYSHAETLTAMDGRGVAQPGGEEAAAYIAGRFEAYGLKPAWKHNQFIFNMETTIVRPIEQPAFSLLDDNRQVLASYQHQIDFGYMIEGHSGEGDVAAPITFVGFDPNHGPIEPEEYKGLNLDGRIVFLYKNNAPPDFPTEALIRGAVGVVWVVGDGRDDVRSQIQFAFPEKNYLLAPNLPAVLVRPHVADKILEQAQMSTAQLFESRSAADQSGSGWFTKDLKVEVAISVELGEPEIYQVPNVLGYLSGSDFTVARELVIIYVNYDGLGMDPNGTIYPAANHNAAGLGVMLELAQLWQRQELIPRRSVMFVAWGGGQLENSGIEDFLEDNGSFRHLTTESISQRTSPAYLIQLDFIGDGGDELLVHPSSSDQLFTLLMETNQEQGNLEILTEAPSSDFTQDIVSRRYPWIAFRWVDANVSPSEDSLDRLTKDKLQQFGELLSLILTKIVRENKF